MLDSIINRPNKTPHYQKLYQANPNVPIYMKHPRSKFLIYPFYAIFGVGIVGSFWGLTRMARGIKE
ncbi:hypothetical protein YB2330_000672 [Saitoella coloradoensis]